MFRTAVAIRWKLLVLMAVLGMGVVVAGLGGAAWWVLRCDMRDFVDRAALSPLNTGERYLFACGYVWHSADAGRTWVRGASRGLPVLTRDGFIAVDRQPGTLYLGLLITTQSSAYCWDCAWRFRRPAVYVSTDSGQTWSFAYKFRRGPAHNNGFLGLFTDPGESGSVWALVKNEDEISYYGSRTAGQSFSRICLEYYFVGSGGCEFPIASIQQDLLPQPVTDSGVE